MVRKKKKESKAKIVTNKDLFRLEAPEAFKLEKEEIKAVRRYIG